MTVLHYVLWVLIAWNLGVAISYIINGVRDFDAGWDAAKSVFSDWDDGYHAGYDAAFGVMRKVCDAYFSKDKAVKEGNENETLD